MRALPLSGALAEAATCATGLGVVVGAPVAVAGWLGAARDVSVAGPPVGGAEAVGAGVGAGGSVGAATFVGALLGSPSAAREARVTARNRRKCRRISRTSPKHSRMASTKGRTSGERCARCSLAGRTADVVAKSPRYR